MTATRRGLLAALVAVPVLGGVVLWWRRQSTDAPVPAAPRRDAAGTSEPSEQAAGLAALREMVWLVAPMTDEGERAPLDLVNQVVEVVMRWENPAPGLVVRTRDQLIASQPDPRAQLQSVSLATLGKEERALVESVIATTYMTTNTEFMLKGEPPAGVCPGPLGG